VVTGGGVGGGDEVLQPVETAPTPMVIKSRIRFGILFIQFEFFRDSWAQFSDLNSFFSRSALAFEAV